VGEQREQQDEDEGDEQPVQDEAQERELEDVEADVGVELAVRHVCPDVELQTGQHQAWFRK